eukprot:GEZU01020280.1.p1 GENE.GEZU01020280.1~~GEZU01020280.1.p1  ORF type:complete len:199 (-),score=35.69 GEZU01020280.1:208-804(-)
MTTTNHFRYTFNIDRDDDNNETTTPSCTLDLLLFRDVQNVPEIRNKLMQKELEWAIINPEMIVGLLQVAAAANKAVNALVAGKLKTRNVHSELVYDLSPSRNISEAFAKFGITEKNTTILVGLFNASQEQLAAVASLVQGTLVPKDEMEVAISKLTNTDAVTKVYKVTKEELQLPARQAGSSPLLEAVVSRIAIREAL